MRDVLGGMEELAAMKNYEISNSVFEVISIDPSEAEKESQKETNDTKTKEPGYSAEIIPMDQFRNQAGKKD